MRANLIWGMYSMTGHAKLQDSDIVLIPSLWILNGIKIILVDYNLSFNWSINFSRLDFASDLYLNGPTLSPFGLV